MLRDGPSKATLPYSPTPKYYPTTLILSPTRELALQIHAEALRFCYCTGIAPAVVYGGTSMQATEQALSKGCDILIGTPGRLMDLIERERIGLEGITYVMSDK